MAVAGPSAVLRGRPPAERRGVDVGDQRRFLHHVLGSWKRCQAFARRSPTHSRGLGQPSLLVGHVVVSPCRQLGCARRQPARVSGLAFFTARAT